MACRISDRPLRSRGRAAARSTSAGEGAGSCRHRSLIFISPSERCLMWRHGWGFADRRRGNATPRRSARSAARSSSAPRRPLVPDARPRLEGIRAREKAATKGPWAFKIDGIIAKIILPSAEFREFSHHDPPNAEFIAHARADIPHLLALVDDLAGALRELGGDGSDPDDCWGHCAEFSEHHSPGCKLARAALARTEA